MPPAARLLALLVAAPLATACQSERPFKTSAVYENADRRCTMRLDTQGIVRPGEDLARDAEGRLTLSSSSQGPGARPLDAVVALRSGEVTMNGATGRGVDSLLTVNLTAVGCALTPAEQGELRRAVDGVLGGPKGTLMEGQTKVLRVVSVRFNR